MEASESNNKELVKRTYGKIVLTLENAILSAEKLEAPTISEEDGLCKEIETDLRILGCELIQSAGILLKLPQVSMQADCCFPISSSRAILSFSQFILDLLCVANVKMFVNVYSLLIEKTC